MGSGWNRSVDPSEKINRDAKKRSTTSKLRGLIAGGVVVLGAVVALLLIIHGGDDSSASSSQRGKSRIRDVGSAITKSDQGKQSTPVRNGAANATKGDASTNGVAKGLGDLPQMGELPEPPKPIHKSVFSSFTDQVLSMAVNTRGEIPPLPYTPDMDKEFKRSLEEKIVINDDDSESVKAAKENVIAVREEMRELLKEGKTVREVLEEFRERTNFQREMHNMVAVEAQKILDSGDAEGARKFVIKMNVALDQKGIEMVDFPMTKEERREKIRQRILERQEQQQKQ